MNRLLFSLALFLFITGVSPGDDRLAVKLLTPDGQLVLLFKGDRELKRLWKPSGGRQAFEPLRVTEAWLFYPTVKERAFVIGGRVTAVSAWSTVTGTELDPSALPLPPPALLSLVTWTGSPAASPPGDVSSLVDSIVAQEEAFLGIGSSEELSKPFEEETTTTIERYWKPGFSVETSLQPNSTSATIETTRNFYVEYSSSWSKTTPGLERKFDSRASLGSVYHELEIEYSYASPLLDKNRYDLSASMNLEKQLDESDTVADSLTCSFSAEGERVLSEKTESNASLELSSVNYLGNSDYSYDNKQLKAELEFSAYAGNSKISMNLSYEDMFYPDDPGSDFTRSGFELSANGDRNKFTYELVYLSTFEEADNGTVSLESGAVADNYREDELSLNLGWNFNERFSSEFTLTQSEKDWDNPNESNFDNDCTELAQELSWEMGKGFSISSGFHWTFDRYKDRDGDDGVPGALIEESLDNNDSKEFQASLTYSSENLELSLDGTWEKIHYPESSQSGLDENVDGLTRELGFSLDWSFVDFWSFELSAERSVETFQSRSEDDTITRSLTASLTHTF